MLDSASLTKTYSTEQAFLDSFKAYVNSPDYKGFDKQAYDNSVKGYMPVVVKNYDNFFAAMEQFAKTKDEATFKKSLEDFLKNQYANSYSPYGFATDTNQTKFGDFVLKENLKSFLSEIDAFVAAGNSLEKVDWKGYDDKDHAAPFVTALENYVKTKVIDQQLIDAYKEIGGWNVMSWAAYYQQAKLATFLVAKGYDFNTKYGDADLPPLALAGLSPNPKVLIEFVNMGANPNTVFDDYYSLIAFASQNAINADGIKVTLAKGANVDQAGKHSGVTPLMLASQTNLRIDAVEELLAANANVNAQDSALNGFTPLMYAAMGRGGRPVIERMIAKGAYVTLTSYDGSTALHAAMWGSKPEVVGLLLGKQVVNVNAVESMQGQTAVCLCAYLNRDGTLKILESLVDAKADLNVRDKDGNTALDYTIQNKNQVAEKYLRDNGAKRGAELQTYTQAATSYMSLGLTRLMQAVSLANDNKPQHPWVAKYASTSGVQVEPKDFHPSMIVHSKYHHKHFRRSYAHEQDSGLGK